ncbi:MAG: hypothetical protein GY802_13415, partial [Gammaproteobacteria bacterium]|nr:hypothetical protein [Gammaproteobacteria bacterium]
MFSADLTGKESAEVGFFDLQDNDRFYSIGETSAWNWQMGSQLQWLQGKTDRQLIYNSRAVTADANNPYADFCSTVYSLETQTSRQLPLPVYVVAANSEWALCVDYSRFQVTHPTIGYAATRV